MKRIMLWYLQAIEDNDRWKPLYPGNSILCTEAESAERYCHPQSQYKKTTTIYSSPLGSHCTKNNNISRSHIPQNSAKRGEYATSEKKLWINLMWLQEQTCYFSMRIWELETSIPLDPQVKNNFYELTFKNNLFALKHVNIILNTLVKTF